MKKIVLLTIVAFVLVCIAGCGEISVNDILPTNLLYEVSAPAQEDESELSESVENTVYNEGDILIANGKKISYEKCEEYQPEYSSILEDGYKVVRVYFSVENVGSSDFYIGAVSFDCYADNSAAENWIWGDEKLDYTELSPGRKNSGYVYFEVPIEANVIEIEYEINSRTNEKAIFKVDL